MSNQVSYGGEPFLLDKLGEDNLLDLVYETLENDVPEEETVPRIERDFASDDVFVQTNDFNVFIRENGLSFQHLERDMVETLYGNDYDWKDEESEEILGKIVFLYEVEDPLKEFRWY